MYMLHVCAHAVCARYGVWCAGGCCACGSSLQVLRPQQSNQANCTTWRESSSGQHGLQSNLCPTCCSLSAIVAHAAATHQQSPMTTRAPHTLEALALVEETSDDGVNMAHENIIVAKGHKVNRNVFRSQTSQWPQASPLKRRRLEASASSSRRRHSSRPSPSCPPSSTRQRIS